MSRDLAESLDRLTNWFQLLDRHLHLIDERLERTGRMPKPHHVREEVHDVNRMYRSCLQEMQDLAGVRVPGVQRQPSWHPALTNGHASLVGICHTWLEQNDIPDSFDITALGRLIDAVRKADRALMPEWATYSGWGRSALRGFVADQYDCLLDSVGGMSEDALNKPGTVGAWSARDTLAHVLAWEEYGWAILSQWPEPQDGSLARWEVGNSINDGNSRLLGRYADRDLIDVLGDLYTFRRRTLRFIDRTEDATLASTGSWGWDESGGLTEFILSMACHCTEHALQILDARERDGTEP